jgi:hypothetical protein
MSNKYLDITGVEKLWAAVRAADAQVVTDAKSNTIDAVKDNLEIEYTDKRVYLKYGDTVLSDFDAQAFINDGMLEDVTIITSSVENPVEYDGEEITNGTKFIRFTWNTAVDGKPNEEGMQTKVQYLRVDEIGKTYIESDSIAIGDDNKLSVKEVDFEKTKLSSSIQVAGGPLANNIEEAKDVWPSGWTDAAGNKIIPSDLTMKQILEGLFLKVVNGSASAGKIAWNPTLSAPTVSLKPGPVEVGTTLTASITLTNTVNSNTRSVTVECSQGHFNATNGTHQAGNKVISKTGTSAGTATASWTWNGTATDSKDLKVTSTSTHTLVVTQSGITASVDALPQTTVYPSTNTKALVKDGDGNIVFTTVTDTKPSDKPLTSSTTKRTYGDYYIYYGVVSGVLTAGSFNSSVVKGLPSKIFCTNMSGDLVPKVVIPANGNTYVVAVPDDYTLKQVLKLGNDGKGVWQSEGGPKAQTNVKLADDVMEKSYNIYFATNEGGADSEFTNLQVGK